MILTKVNDCAFCINTTTTTTTTTYNNNNNNNNNNNRNNDTHIYPMITYIQNTNIIELNHKCGSSGKAIACQACHPVYAYIYNKSMLAVTMAINT